MSGTPRSEAAFRWSPARMPRPPEYCGSGRLMPNSGEKYADRARRVGAERLEPARLERYSRSPCALALGPLHVAAVGRELLEPRGVDLAEERDGIPSRAAPQLGVDVLEQALRRLVPRPPEVAGELLERGQRAGDDGPDGELANRLHALHPRSTACRMCERPVSSIALDMSVPARPGAGGASIADAVARRERLRGSPSRSRRARHSALRSERDHPRSPGRPDPGDPGHPRPPRRPMEAQGLRGRGRAVPRDRLPRGP